MERLHPRDDKSIIMLYLFAEKYNKIKSLDHRHSIRVSAIINN